MPLYEYECDACGRRFEIIRKFSDPPLDACPTCGGAVHKLISSPAFQFKGTGWYITDYAKKNQPAPPSEPTSDTAGKDKTEKSGDKSVTGEKSEKADKAEKAEKTEKAGKGESKAEPKPSTGEKPAPAAGKGTT